jgi:tRNA-specific 2-thiouridylase
MKKENKHIRVVVGLSGGVDSSVTAALLLEQGYEVIGVYMRNWHDDSVTINNECPWIDDSNDALLVAQHLQIPFQVLDLCEAYKNRIVDYMFSEYENGRTPNPDVLCNREIKFDVFLKHALDLGADFVATGHYCRKRAFNRDGIAHYELLAGIDGNKDQSYFLCQINQAQLAKALFPIGELEKPVVRALAEKYQLPTAKKKDSQGLCFVGKIRLPEFLQLQLKPKKGNVILLPDPSNQDGRQTAASELFEQVEAKKESQIPEAICSDYHYDPSQGKVIGTHQGAHYFTIGQRKGLGIGGSDEPLFVVKTDTKQNLVYVVKGEQHPLLYRRGLMIRAQEVHWIDELHRMHEGEQRIYQVRIRYRQKTETCMLLQEKEGLYLLFEHPIKGIAPGQFAVWYQDEVLMGSGVISSI